MAFKCRLSIIVPSCCYCGSHVTARGCCDHWCSDAGALGPTQPSMCAGVIHSTWLPGYVTSRNVTQSNQGAKTYRCNLLPLNYDYSKYTISIITITTILAYQTLRTVFFLLPEHNSFLLFVDPVCSRQNVFVNVMYMITFPFF